MNHKHIALIALFLVIVLTTLMVLNIAQKQPSSNIDFTRLSNLPLYDLNNNEYYLFQNAQDPYVLLSFVQSDCYACHVEIKQLSDSLASVKDLKIFLISSELSKQLDLLNTLITNKKITLLSDKDSIFTHTLEVTSYPTSFLFDRSKLSLKRIRGIVSVREIEANIL